jgi:tRNA(adenine34) deaminase
MSELDASTLGDPMRRALELAWESICAGSFGIGAVAVDRTGTTVATGRNRIFESDPGDDVICNSSLAHAETNVLAKMPFRAHADAGIVLHTSLQPCLQCLGAVRLSVVERVEVLAPDPLWRGIERIVGHNEWLRESWPTIVELPVDEWSVFSLLLPTYTGVAKVGLKEGWAEHLPRTTALAEQLFAGGELDDAIAGGADLDQVTDLLADRLSQCVAEVEAIAAIAPPGT